MRESPALLHPIAAHRDERRRAWKLRKFLNIRHAQAAEDHLVPHGAVNMFLMTSR